MNASANASVIIDLPKDEMLIKIAKKRYSKNVLCGIDGWQEILQLYSQYVLFHFTTILHFTSKFKYVFVHFLVLIS